MYVRVKTDSQIVVDAANDLNSRAFKQHASLVVVHCRKTGRVLVVRRHKDNQIGLPCGKIDIGEHPIDASKRELFEETGIMSVHISNLLCVEAIQFEGTLVHVYKASVESEKVAVGAAPGFEDETTPLWMKVEELSKVDSRFTSFNIVAMHKAGLL